MNGLQAAAALAVIGLFVTLFGAMARDSVNTGTRTYLVACKAQCVGVALVVPLLVRLLFMAVLS